MARGDEERKMQAMADRLTDYWQARGFLVNAWVEKIYVAWTPGTRRTSGTHWVIRSDMTNGHPTKRIPE